MAISIMCFTGLTKKTELNVIVGVVSIFIFSLSTSIILNSLLPLVEVLRKEFTYSLSTKFGPITCDFFFEYDEHYLVIKEGNQRFIKKGDVYQIIKNKYDN